MSWSPTTDQILNLQDVRRRIDRFRFELCDQNLVPIGELHPDRSGSAAQIQNDTSNNTSRRLTNLKLIPSEATAVNMLRDRLRVYMILQNNVTYRLGTFLWAGSSEPQRSWGREHTSELVDYTYVLNQPSTQAFGWGSGGVMGLIIFFLFFRAGFQLDDFAVLGDEANRGLVDPLSWQPGTTWLQMLTDLGNTVGFAPPWFDRNGKMHFDQAPDPRYTQATVAGYEAGTRIIADSIVHSNDLLSAANDFAVFDSGTDRLRIGRYQVPTSAPHSFANRGFRVGKTESVQGAATQDQLNKNAVNLARTSDVYEYVTFSSTADPRHETFDVVDALGERWLETAWSLELRSGGPMQHTLKRVTYDVV